MTALISNQRAMNDQKNNDYTTSGPPPNLASLKVSGGGTACSPAALSSPHRAPITRFISTLAADLPRFIVFNTADKREIRAQVTNLGESQHFKKTSGRISLQ